MNDRQALYSENDSDPQTGIELATFWWPVRRSNYWPTETQMVSWGTTSIYMYDLSGSHYILIMIDAVFVLRNVIAWINLKRDEWSSSPNPNPNWGSESFSEYRTWRSFISLKIYPSSHISQNKNFTYFRIYEIRTALKALGHKNPYGIINLCWLFHRQRKTWTWSWAFRTSRFESRYFSC